ncbi:hypothetical protein [Loigolactobacillus iwatensis]|uniref:hypothetical protein n=1 Tax=Loigolactobacillus iwatensis TaxID=1267156 RepID=UPI000F7DE631|nr:hypothetical protein [Loigolactobacillus iwatensis]
MFENQYQNFHFCGNKLVQQLSSEQDEVIYEVSCSSMQYLIHLVGRVCFLPLGARIEILNQVITSQTDKSAKELYITDQTLTQYL